MLVSHKLKIKTGQKHMITADMLLVKRWQEQSEPDP